MDCQASAQEYTIPGTGTNFPFGIFRGLFTVIQTPVEPIRVGCTIVGAQRKKSPMLETCLLSFSLPISFVGGTVWDLESRSWRC